MTAPALDASWTRKASDSHFSGTRSPALMEGNVEGVSIDPSSQAVAVGLREDGGTRLQSVGIEDGSVRDLGPVADQSGLLAEADRPGWELNP
jgi:hypothetical protein